MIDGRHYNTAMSNNSQYPPYQPNLNYIRVHLQRSVDEGLDTEKTFESFVRYHVAGLAKFSMEYNRMSRFYTICFMTKDYGGIEYHFKFYIKK